MGVFTPTLLVVFFIFSLTSAFEEIKVKSGDDVTLQCQSPGGKTISLLEWRRPDLKKDEYVFFYRNNRSYESYQHPSFRGRVQLRDPEMRNGDVSVILKNVNINDTGTYECQITNSEGITETKDIINFLSVTLAEGDKDGPNTTVVGLSVTGVLLLFLLLGIFSFIYIRKRRESTMTSYQPPAETGSVPLQQ